MLKTVSRYLDEVRSHLKLDRVSESEVIRELETHIEDRLDEMKETGISDEEAVQKCLNLLGSSQIVARRLYEAHSQGTWRQALMGSLPHLLFALLFVLNWWQGIGWLIIVLGLVLGTALYGWLHGRPIWLFPWLGYFLVPVIGAGLMLLYLPRGWSWLAVLAYIPLAFLLLRIVAIQTVRRDWLYGALMLLPVPMVIAWFLVAARGNWYLGLNLEQISNLTNWIGLSFVILAATAVIFFRVRQRWLKVAVLPVSGISILIMIAFYAGPKLNFATFLLLAVILAGLIFSPAFLDKRLRSKDKTTLYSTQSEIADI
jgi:hypothetical protein